AEVCPGKAVAVVGDGAVGLCGVIAARRLGAERILILGRHPDRIALAREFGATDVVRERGDEAVERVRKLTDGLGAHSVLECVGLEQALDTRWSSPVPAAQLAAWESPGTTPRRPASPSGRTRALPEVRPQCAPTSRSCCPTSSKVGSSPGAFSTASDRSTRCPRAIGS